MPPARGLAAPAKAVLIVVLLTATSACGSPPSKTGAPRQLRGVSVAQFTCAARRASATVRPARIDGADTLLLCPLDVPGEQARTVTVPSRDPRFAQLVRALSAPDEPRTTGACPAYADVPQVVLARTPRGAYEVAIPVDDCGHYQRPAVAALNAARGG